MEQFKKLAIRTATALVFVAAMVLGFLFSQAFLVLMSVVILCATIEYFRLIGPKDRYEREKFCIILAGISFFVLSFLARSQVIPALCIMLSFVPVLLAFLFMLSDCSADLDFPSGLFLPLIYIALPIASSLLIAIAPDGSFHGRLLFAVFCLIWFNDVGAYIIGMLFGQKTDSRKLSPVLSPKKSYAGLWGGIVTTIVLAVAFHYILDSVIPVYHWIAIAILTSLFGLWGDLFESLIKRHANVKDSGNILPGHGGMLDRFDAAFFVLPVVALYLQIFSLL